MKSTSALTKLEPMRQALITKLMLRAWTEAFTSDDGLMHPATWEALRCLGATDQHKDAAMRAIIDVTTGGRGQPFWWRRKPMPTGPLMQQAVKACRQWKAKQPQPDERKFAIDISGDENQYFIDGVEVDEDTYEAQAPPSTGEFFIDIGPYDETELDPDETEPAPAPVELQPIEPVIVEPVEPKPPKRVTFNM